MSNSRDDTPSTNQPQESWISRRARRPNSPIAYAQVEARSVDLAQAVCRTFPKYLTALDALLASGYEPPKEINDLIMRYKGNSKILERIRKSVEAVVTSAEAGPELKEQKTSFFDKLGKNFKDAHAIMNFMKIMSRDLSTLIEDTTKITQKIEDDINAGFRRDGIIVGTQGTLNPEALKRMNLQDCNRVLAYYTFKESVTPILNHWDHETTALLSDPEISKAYPESARR